MFIILGTAGRAGGRLGAGQPIYIRHETEGRSHIYLCRGKAEIVTYSAFMSVDLCIQHGKGTRRGHIVTCGLSGCNIFFHIIP
jgi:hypothetical protein